MIEFQVIKKSNKSLARLGILKTSHGEIETPTLVPVATQAVIKTLTSEEVLETKTQILISNTFHLHLKPGEDFIRKSGGLHKFMNWRKPIMTDSGGFQVFSLGFGHDLNVGKLLKYFPGKNHQIIEHGKQPKRLKITDDGVIFKSPIDGKELFIGPKKSIDIQKKLGADIIFAFDECTAPLCSYDYAKKALKRTHNWAKICVESMRGNKKQSLFGIIQGSRFKDLREEGADFINSLDFAGFGIGGYLGEDKRQMKEVVGWAVSRLQVSKPRHLLGIGYLEDIENIIKWGIDTFDCTVPTHYARRGIAFTGAGKINFNKTLLLKSKISLDKNCSCFVCKNYKRNYIAHLIRAKEITGMKLLTFHNLYYFNNFVEKIREKIKSGKL